MVVSASRRTDIPAWYGQWFMNRLEEGFCEVANPFNPRQVRRVSFERDQVDAIVFWTRYPENFLRHLPRLEAGGYRYYFHVTLLDYPRLFEPALPPLDSRIDAFRKLSDIAGPERVLWRYDPIVLTGGTGLEFHLRTFSRLADMLRGYTRRCTVSLMDRYEGARSRMCALEKKGYALLEPAGESPGFRRFVREMAACGADAGIPLVACAGNSALIEGGIRAGKCVDDELIGRLTGRQVAAKKARGQRPGCRCMESVDIGAYGTCPFGCAYCYANRSFDRSLENYTRHDPASPSLLWNGSSSGAQDTHNL